MNPISVRSHEQERQDHRRVTVDDFQRIFTMHMAELFRLAFLICANCSDAEACFEAALMECIKSFTVWKGLELVWARRMIIRNAIRLLFAATHDGHFLSCSVIASKDDLVVRSALFRNFEPLSKVLDLERLERTAFVLCLLEGLAIRDCALLLTRLPREVIDARSQAAKSFILLASEDAGTAPSHSFPASCSTISR